MTLRAVNSTLRRCGTRAVVTGTTATSRMGLGSRRRLASWGARGEGADKLSSEVVQLQPPATSIVIVAWWDAGSGRDSSIWIQEGFIPCVAAYY